ncbi:hypothetical protein [Elizabethkingia bruuniana]|uniref:hypothetical protein n=1 Tax=Elizabethkingia bruuniana TaxID=1756149 RepID=UPI00241E13B9|nr:hypothetical protein [Elizabethkingia bruuniana]
MLALDSDFITEEFGDRFAYNLNVNFQTKTTIIDFGRYITEDSAPNKKMIFRNIIWQEFSEFDFCNIFNTIEIDRSFAVFYKKKKKYFENMEKYIPEKILIELMTKDLYFYSFVQTKGLDCFVITERELEIQIL